MRRVRVPSARRTPVADLLRRGQSDGALSSALDAAVEAARLLALSHGLSTRSWSGSGRPGEAMDVLGYHLDRPFGRL